MALLNLHLKVWRQTGNQPGHFQDIEAPEIPDHASFLEMMDIVNERLIRAGQDPVAFDHDCREGLCGMCSMTINGMAHGPERGTTTCQLHMRKFRTGDTIWVEPFRARAFPVVKDLVVNRSAFDRVIAAGLATIAWKDFFQLRLAGQGVVRAKKNTEPPRGPTGALGRRVDTWQVRVIRERQNDHALHHEDRHARLLCATSIESPSM
jgi:hypothetical protein